MSNPISKSHLGQSTGADTSPHRPLYIHVTLDGNLSISSVQWDHAEYLLSCLLSPVPADDPAYALESLRKMLRRSGALVVVENLNSAGCG